MWKASPSADELEHSHYDLYHEFKVVEAIDTRAKVGIYGSTAKILGIRIAWSSYLAHHQKDSPSPKSHLNSSTNMSNLLIGLNKLFFKDQPTRLYLNSLVPVLRNMFHRQS